MWQRPQRFRLNEKSSAHSLSGGGLSARSGFYRAHASVNRGEHFQRFVDIQPCVELHVAAQNHLPFAVAEPRQFVRAAGFGVVNPVQAR